MYKIRKSTFDDIKTLQDNLRKEDIEELKLRNKTPVKALTEGYYFSEQCYTGLYKNKPIAMFGAGRRFFSRDGKRIASIWFLGTDELNLYKIEFLKKALYYMNIFKKDFDVLENVTDVKNTKYIKWLKWLGFDFGEPFDVSGGQLIPFSLNIR